MEKIHANILDSIDALGYESAWKSPEDVNKAINLGPNCKDFTDLVAWLSSELSILYSLEEKVHPLEKPEDVSSFLLELSSFLKECDCPYATLTEGPISQRLETPEQKAQLLDFLCTELQAARITAQRDLGDASSNQNEPGTMEESPVATDLRLMCQVLGFSKPPDTITSQQLFGKLITKVKEQMSRLPQGFLPRPLVDPGALLSSKQWELLENLNEDLKADYKMRFELLLKRLDVSVSSFTWCERVKKMEDKLGKIYGPRRIKLMTSSKIGLADVLAAREDLTTIEKTCGSRVRKNTQTKLTKVMMQGRMPDRGGRPDEIQPPPPEMPAWQKDRAPAFDGRGGGRGGGDRGGRGGAGGGRIQGGWNQGGRGGGYQRNQQGYQKQNSYDSGYSQGGGGGGYYQNQQSFGSQQGGYYQHDNRGFQGGSNYTQGGGDFQRYGGGGQQQQGRREFSRGGRGRSRGGDRYRE